MMGLDVLYNLRNKDKPFRFLYMSGVAAARDQSEIDPKLPKSMVPYALLRVRSLSLLYSLLFVVRYLR
jgi:hypothetical protein